MLANQFHQKAKETKGVPSCIVLTTCKGKGATFAEPKHDHSSQPKEEQWLGVQAEALHLFRDVSVGQDIVRRAVQLVAVVVDEVDDVVQLVGIGAMTRST